MDELKKTTVPFRPLMDGGFQSGIDRSEAGEAARAAVDASFFERAKSALAKRGVTALKFMSQNPRVSILELAKRLNHGANAFGLLRVIDSEACASGTLREIAKDLLLRRIFEEYPTGWTLRESICTIVRLGFWYDSAGPYAVEARRINKYFDSENPPLIGWMPQYPSDPHVDAAFDDCWPMSVDRRM